MAGGTYLCWRYLLWVERYPRWLGATKAWGTYTSQWEVPTLAWGTYPRKVSWYLPWLGEYRPWLGVPSLAVGSSLVWGVPTLFGGGDTYIELEYLRWHEDYLLWLGVPTFAGSIYPSWERCLHCLSCLGGTYPSQWVLPSLVGAVLTLTCRYLPQLEVPTFAWGSAPTLARGYTFLGDLKEYFSLRGCSGPVKISKYVKLSKRCEMVKKMSNVKKSNTGTMEEVHRKK